MGSPRHRTALVVGIVGVVVLLLSPTVEANGASGGSPDQFPAVVPVGVGLVLGIGFALAVVALALPWVRRNWSRGRRAVVLAVAALLLVAPGTAWAWSLLHPTGNPPYVARQLTPGDQYMAQYYNSPWGGLTLPHQFGPGKHNHNPPDILEAAGYMVALKLTPDGSQPDSFTLETLQGKRFTFLVRPELVPVNWDLERFEVTRACGSCFTALHFTKKDIGNVAIVLFPVISEQTD